MRNSRGLSAPNINEMMDKYQVNLPGKVEVIWQPIYDFQVAAQAATVSQVFFQVPQGQSGKTLADTNMTLAGQIPAGQRFAITGIEVFFFPGVLINQTDVDNAFSDDVYSFYNNGALQMTVGSKPYTQQGPLMSFPPSTRLAGYAASSTTADESSVNYASVAGREYAIRDIVLQSSQNFDVTLLNRAAISVAGRVGVKLNGWLFRNAQ